MVQFTIESALLGWPLIILLTSKFLLISAASDYNCNLFEEQIFTLYSKFELFRKRENKLLLIKFPITIGCEHATHAIVIFWSSSFLLYFFFVWTFKNKNYLFINNFYEYFMKKKLNALFHFSFVNCKCTRHQEHNCDEEFHFESEKWKRTAIHLQKIIE